MEFLAAKCKHSVAEAHAARHKLQKCAPQHTSCPNRHRLKICAPRHSAHDARYNSYISYDISSIKRTKCMAC